jgi:hypothetical protein
VSFVELSRIEGFQAPCEMLAPASFGENIILWRRISMEAVSAVNELQAEGKVHMYPTDLLVYLVDGGMLSLPLAKQARNYKKSHWLPVCFHLGKYKKKSGKGKIAA